MEEEGIIAVGQGRNTRYGKFKYLNQMQDTNIQENKKTSEVKADETNIAVLMEQIKTMSNLIEQLRQRIRTQEMSTSVLQDRVAEIEDKIS